jgi:hypothetical protein
VVSKLAYQALVCLLSWLISWYLLFYLVSSVKLHPLFSSFWIEYIPCSALSIKFEILPSRLQARNLLRKAGEDVPVELLNGIGLLHFEKGELEVC